jgi:hypothetical protein
MTYLEWITKIEKIVLWDYVRFPEAQKNKIRNNYRDYCESYALTPVMGRM